MFFEHRELTLSATKKLKQTSDIPAWFDKEKETVEPTETDREAFDELDKILQELV